MAYYTGADPSIQAVSPQVTIMCDITWH